MDALARRRVALRAMTRAGMVMPAAAARAG
jgi:hypothetical protein